MDSAKPTREIIDSLMLLKSPSPKDVTRIKTRVAARYHLGSLPSNVEILAGLRAEERKHLWKLLRRKSARTISGVTVVAVMTKPHPCPQDEPCAYCPGGPSQGVPQSYTGHEPAAMRGSQNNYDPFKQVRSRIDQLTAIGHNVDKIELIIMGGTFPATPPEYQNWFIKRCLDAITEKESRDLEEAKEIAERSRMRNVGITVETRPDWAKSPHVDAMLNMGVTRVELGVQNPDDEIYRLVGRSHRVSDVIEATRAAKDAGLKILYHLMPGMPGSNPAKDLVAFERVFTDPSFKPDMIKIYPCLVIKGTKSFEWFERGEFAPYSTDEAANVIAKIKKSVPAWVRIMRVQRDIPARLIAAGVKKSNLRQLVQQKMFEHGEHCKCIRCREVGHLMAHGETFSDTERVKVLSNHYEASRGEEIFISAEIPERNALIGYLRLRIPSYAATRPEITASPSAIVRELHVYGPLVPVGRRSNNAWQHKGYGAILLKEAERMSKEEFDLKKVLVISALGTKQYYRHFGYEKDGVYMSKKLED